MKILRALWFWVKVIVPVRVAKPREFPDNPTKKSGNAFSRLLGKIHRWGKNRLELRRIRRFEIQGEIKEHKILPEIFKYSKWILLYLLFASLLAIVTDAIFSQVIGWLRGTSWLSDILSVPSKGAIGDALTAYIAAVSALLGLIFALYAVGFQLTTDRYSEKVTSFISNERVSSYFFRFMVFTDLFAVIVYLKLVMFDTTPIFSFGLATLLVATSFLGIIIFKNHYIEIIKPESMFSRLRELIWDSMNVVSTPGSYTNKSWSLATHARRHAQSNMRTMEALYRDLTRKGIDRSQNWTDAAFAPLTAGHLLQGYSSLRKFINVDKPWWTAQKYEKVKSSDMNMYTIKLQHELKGTGPLIVPQNHPLWFEDRMFSFLEEITKDVVNDDSGQIFMNVSDAYKTALIGDQQKQVDEPPKTLPGAWQNQEFDIFERGFTAFLELWKKIDICTHKATVNYLNDYFMIVSELIEPWDIEGIMKIAESFYTGDQLNKSKKFLEDKDLPTFSRSVLKEYWERLEVEQELEGKIVTEKNHLLEEMKEVLTEKHSDLVDKYLIKAFDDSTEIIKKLAGCKKHELLTNFVKMQMEWISHLLYADQKDRADLYAQYVKDNSRYLLIVPQSVLEEEELLDQVEKGYFVSLIEERKDTFEAYSLAVSIVMMKGNWQQTDQNQVMRNLKQSLIHGSLAFVLSELRQDSFWVVTFTKNVEGMFKPGVFTKLLELVADIHDTRDIYWESTRYMNWERFMLGKIKSEVKETWVHEDGEIGYGTEYDHPSKFIRRLGDFDLLFNGRSKESYVEWLKKRQALKELLEVLIKIKGSDDAKK